MDSTRLGAGSPFGNFEPFKYLSKLTNLRKFSEIHLVDVDLFGVTMETNF